MQSDEGEVLGYCQKLERESRDKQIEKSKGDIHGRLNKVQQTEKEDRILLPRDEETKVL